MNFEEWLRFSGRFPDEDSKYYMELGWVICKDQILKLLEQNIEEIKDGDNCVLKYIDAKILEEIKEKI